VGGCWAWRSIPFAFTTVEPTPDVLPLPLPITTPPLIPRHPTATATATHRAGCVDSAGSMGNYRGPQYRRLLPGEGADDLETYNIIVMEICDRCVI
jgi:hypothetical protein